VFDLKKNKLKKKPQIFWKEQKTDYFCTRFQKTGKHTNKEF